MKKQLLYIAALFAAMLIAGTIDEQTRQLEQQHLTFVDEQDNMYTISLRGRFWKNDDPEFDLDFVTLEKDGISFSFDINIFDDHI